MGESSKSRKPDPYIEGPLLPWRLLGAGGGALIALAAVALGAIEHYRSDIAPSSVLRAAAADGLRTENIDISYDGRTATLVLDLGSCSVKEVRAELAADGNQVTDASGYQFSGISLAQAYRDRKKVSGTKGESVTVSRYEVEGTPKTFRFESYTELQEQLGPDPCHTLGVTRFVQVD